MGMFAEATGLENASIMATIAQIPRRARKKFITDVGDISGLKAYMKMPVRTYSSGMRLRLAFAMAISIDTDVIVLDEIIAVADEEFTTYMLRCINNLTMNKKSLVIASHTKQLVNSLCHRIIYLNNGTLISNERVTQKENTEFIT
jgi:ABC-type polysaccharide/polyol phosphate transport system ATPase subunit